MHEAKNRRRTVMFFVTDDEKKQIAQRAASAKQTISKFCRNLALGKTENKED